MTKVLQRKNTQKYFSVRIQSGGRVLIKYPEHVSEMMSAGVMACVLESGINRRVLGCGVTVSWVIS